MIQFDAGKVNEAFADLYHEIGLKRKLTGVNLLSAIPNIIIPTVPNKFTIGTEVDMEKIIANIREATALIQRL